MLDAYVIEEIKRRDRGRSDDDRPSAELPVPEPARVPPDEKPDPGERDRGVVIIDFA